MPVFEFGYRFWNPIVWLIAFAVVMAMVYLFRNRGQKEYKKNTGQVKIFLCGEEVPVAEQRHLKSNNVYWGFFETLEGYYKEIIKPHTGIVNDYVIWLIAVIAISAVVLVIAG